MKKFDDVYDLANHYTKKWDEAYQNGGEAAAMKIRMQFKKALLKYVGLSQHPKADKVWEIVFRREQDFGYEEVAALVRDFAEVLL